MVPLLLAACVAPPPSTDAPTHPKASLPLSWQFALGQAGAGVGGSVSGAGDVDGDGYDDLLVGARYYDGGQTDEGAAMVFLGSPSGPSLTPDWWTESDERGAELGFAVAGIGDVNGDGYDDIAVGVPKHDGTGSDSGRVDVYLGSASGLPARPDWSAGSPTSTGWLGWSVGAAGDVNADGYDDLVAGAPDVDTTGFALLYLGGPGGLPGTYDAILRGSGANTGLGYYVAGVGDIDGDGHDDVGVGEPWYDGGAHGGGRAQLFRGTARGIDTTAGWSRIGTQYDARLGNVVRGAGDLDGDGYADLFVSIGDYDAADTDVGGVEVYAGAAGGLGSTPAWSVLGTQKGEWLEYGGGVGDLDGDGHDDLVVGASGHTDGETGEGAAWMYPGSATGASASPTVTLQPDVAGARFGNAIAGAGDVNGDGLADLLIGAYAWTGTAASEGAAFVYFGEPSEDPEPDTGSDTGSDTAGDSGADTADTGVPPDTADTGAPPDTADTADTAAPDDTDAEKVEPSDPVHVTVGCGCASTGSPVGWAAALAAFTMLRRRISPLP